MFSGIIKIVGEIKGKTPHSLSVSSNMKGRRLGESVAVNGVCLTVVGSRKGLLRFDVSPETWKRTNLSALEARDLVNLEPSLRLGDLLGGHLIAGHVDARAKILAIKKLPQGFILLRVELPKSLKNLVAEKGSVAIDGISLTVTKKTSRYFETVLIPHTLSNTNLRARSAGEWINLEADILARYVCAAILKKP